MKKIILGVVALIIAVGALGGYMYMFSDKETVQPASASPAGTSFNTAKFAGVAVSLANPGANGTSTSILNTDANDRIITGLRAGCESVGTSQTAYTGAGLVSLQVTVATSSTSAPSSNGNTNSVGGGAFVLATTSPQFALSSTTQSTSKVYSIWASGSYLTFTANATNTANCTLGADYVAT